MPLGVAALPLPIAGTLQAHVNDDSRLVSLCSSSCNLVGYPESGSCTPSTARRPTPACFTYPADAPHLGAAAAACSALVAEVMLFSEGFEDSKVLSRKMVQLYKLASEQLSQQVR